MAWPAIRIPRWRLAGTVLALAGGLAALAWLPWPKEKTTLLRPQDGALVARGEAIYRMHCAACHGARLEGQPNWREPGPDGLLPAPPHDASGHTWHHPDELLVRITRDGVAKAANLPDHASAMPAYRGVLQEEEIVAVLSWIKSRWPPEVQRRHDEINRAWAKARPPRH